MRKTLGFCALLVASALVSSPQVAGQGFPSITTLSLPNGTPNGAYSATLTVAGGSPPYANWTVGAGSLPPGLKLNGSTGTIAGTPTASGTFAFWVTVTDHAGGISPAQSLSITTSFPAVTQLTVPPPAGVLDTPYFFALSANGGTPPYGNWTVFSGLLPPGLALSPAAGVISGIPTVVGAYNFSVVVQDSTGVSSAPLPLTLVAGLVIVSNTVPMATLNNAYSAQLSAGGGVPPYANWAVSGGTLPPGLTLAAGSGLLSGTPTATGSYSFSVTVNDSSGNTSLSQPFTIAVAAIPVIATTSLPPGVPGVPYNATLALTGGTNPVVWTIPTGSLPSGLALSANTGAIRGTPQNPAGSSFNFSVQATDATGVTATPQPLTIAITQANLTVAPNSLTFNANQNGNTLPPAQSLSIFSLSAAIAFSATASTTTGGSWLTVNSSLTGSGKTPASILVSANPAGLAPGAYQGAITIGGPNVATSILPVWLIVSASAEPQISLIPTSLSLSYPQGSAADQRYIILNNTGSGSLQYTAQASTQSCGNWLSLLTNSGAATATNPGVIPVLVSPAGLQDGTCQGEIDVSTPVSPGQIQKVMVTITVGAQSQSLLLTQSALTFQAGVDWSPPTQSFSVLNTGVGSLNWSANAQTSDGTNWLTISPSSGTSTRGVVPTPLNVSVNAQGLSPGQYVGSVQVSAPTAGNSPQTLAVELTVLDAMLVPPATPSGVILVGQPTGTSETETVSFSNPWDIELPYTSTVVTDDKLNWLTQTAGTGTIPAGGTVTMSLEANLQGLNPGLQHALVRVAFADGSVHTIDVYLMVPTSIGIAAVLTSPEQGFLATAQTPVTIQVIAKDGKTGKPIKQAGGAQVLALVSGQDDPLTLIDDGTGTWTATWTPTASGPVSLTARVDQYSGALETVVSAEDTITGTVTAPPEFVQSRSKRSQEVRGFVK